MIIRRHVRSASWIAVPLLAIFVGACASASKNKPVMTADAPTPSEEASDTDAGSAWSETIGAADGGATATAEGGTAAGGGTMQGNEEGAKALLTQFVSPTADHAALTRSLRPTTADFKALYDAATAPKIEAAQAKDWDSGKAVIKPKPGQSDVKIWSATGAELASGKGPGATNFPGGYRRVGKHLAPTVTFFRFKFVEAGKDTGTAYDGLAFVNGHWVISPKPWRAMDGAKASGGDADDTEAPTKPAKKPKGKKKK